MKSIIEQMIEKAGVQIQSEVSDWTQSYKMIQGGSPELEVLEFLYALVRIVKPKNCAETGTYAGWSSAVIAQAMKDNAIGDQVITMEIDEYWVKEAEKLHSQLGLTNIKRIHKSSLEYQLDRNVDIFFADSEPQFRFQEVQRFYDNINFGGYIMIHDLHPHLGLSNQINNGMEHWPFGDFRPFFGDKIKNHELQVVNFRTPRGFSLFYKCRQDDTSYRFLNNQL